jgi:hypothetical protein
VLVRNLKISRTQVKSFLICRAKISYLSISLYFGSKYLQEPPLIVNNLRKIIEDSPKNATIHLMERLLRKFWAFSASLVVPLSSKQFLLGDPKGDTPKSSTSPIETVDRKAMNYTAIPIVLSADNNYAPQTYITMLSILDRECQ